MAEGLKERSRGKIKTGVYHADVEKERKKTLHEKWRQGSVKVVCATIGEWCSRQFKGTCQTLPLAFGLGIDKGDVRFVLHHSVRLKCGKLRLA